MWEIHYNQSSSEIEELPSLSEGVEESVTEVGRRVEVAASLRVAAG